MQLAISYQWEICWSFETRGAKIMTSLCIRSYQLPIMPMRFTFSLALSRVHTLNSALAYLVK